MTARATDWGAERKAQAVLLRDLFGSLSFGSVSLNPAWRTPKAISIAQSIYDERLLPAATFDPARLALLADTLTDAGCTKADILGHLRGGREHVRGCWVVDALLAKK
jgi:hypothetical protein